MDEQLKMLTAIQIDIAEMKTDLRHHIQRTALLEAELADTKRSLREEVSFLKKHVYMLQGALALVGLVATIVSILSKL